MTRLPLIAITGGIGAGKSVVSNVLRVMGYEVFDCDTEAKIIMDSDVEIKHRLITEISPLSVSSDGIIDRRHISSVVFSDKSKLELLNSIVHTAVRQRIIEWGAEPHKSDRLFVETAILYQSGLDALVDEVWDVIAPDEIRIMRVINRNKCDRSAVIDRIKSQSFLPENPHPRISTIVNDGFTAVIPQILDLLK